MEITTSHHSRRGAMTSAGNLDGDRKSDSYKTKYRQLKKRLKMLVYENECFWSELREAQHKMITIARDRSFLLDRLLQYEKVKDNSSSDSELTASSDSETETTHNGPSSSADTQRKRKRTQPDLVTPLMPYYMENGDLLTVVNTTLAKKKRYPPTRKIRKKEETSTTSSAGNAAPAVSSASVPSSTVGLAGKPAPSTSSISAGASRFGGPPSSDGTSLAQAGNLSTTMASNADASFQSTPYSMATLQPSNCPTFPSCSVLATGETNSNSSFGANQSEPQPTMSTPYAGKDESFAGGSMVVSSSSSAPVSRGPSTADRSMDFLEAPSIMIGQSNGLLDHIGELPPTDFLQGDDDSSDDGRDFS